MGRGEGAVQGQPSTRGRGKGSRGQVQRPAKILVIDDDPDVVDATRMLLEALGYSVATAASAPEASRELEVERPNVILLDVMMPTGTEGFHFVWDLRNHSDPALSSIPVIIMSAIHRTTDLRLYPDQSDGEYGPGEFLPVQGWLDKPAGLDEMAHVVESVLAGRKPV